MPSSLDNNMLRIFVLENVMYLSLCHLSYFVVSIKSFCSIDLDILRRKIVFSQWVGIGVGLSIIALNTSHCSETPKRWNGHPYFWPRWRILLTGPDTAHMFNQAQQCNIWNALCMVCRVDGCCRHTNLDCRRHTVCSAHGRPVEMSAQHCITIECFRLEWSSQGCIG